MGLFDKAKRGLGYNDEKLKDTGIKGTAKILTSKRTHTTLNADEDGDGGTPVYKQTLLVTVPDREPYEVNYKSHFDFMVGNELDVYVDPKDPKRVYLDAGLGLDGAAQKLSAFTGTTVTSDAKSIKDAAQGFADQFSGAQPGSADYMKMAAESAKTALTMIQDPAQRKMIIEQYRAAGIKIDDDGTLK